MTTVVLSPYDVARYSEGGGHFWVYLHYALGLQDIGCNVLWLESYVETGDRDDDRGKLRTLAERLKRHGLRNEPIFYPRSTPSTLRSASGLFQRAELLINFEYAIHPDVLAWFRRTALVDIDPGMLQFWMATGQLQVPHHDVHFTTGENIGAPGGRVPDAGCRWHAIRPPVSLAAWPRATGPTHGAFTTISSWWGGKGRGEWMVVDRENAFFENNKRTTFLELADLPLLTTETLELALSMDEQSILEAHVALQGETAIPSRLREYASEAEDCAFLLSRGWRIRTSREVSRTPDEYQRYIQQSRGEFSCAKPAYVRFQNAWVSDRTLCYLASGRPAVVQHTGPSTFLPDGEGLFRFRTLHDAATALDAIQAHHERHCQAARAIAETCFDARKVVAGMLNVAL
ncbi:MAG: hypothetical protein AB2A00_10190 [Myxococcota bacterium]